MKKLAYILPAVLLVACSNDAADQTAAQTTVTKPSPAQPSTAQQQTPVESTVVDTGQAQASETRGTNEEGTAQQPAAPATTSANDQHQAPEELIALCQLDKIQKDLGRPELNSQTFCSEQWLRTGRQGTELVVYAQNQGGKWVEVKPDGKMTTGTMGNCYLPDTIKRLNPPPQIDLMACQTGKFKPN